MLAQLEEAQTTIRDRGLMDTMVGSLDMKALYPSLDQNESAEAVARFVRKSKVDVKGVNWRAALVFLASNMTVAEAKRVGLLHLLPKRLKSRGRQPGSTTTELGRKVQDANRSQQQPPESKWAHMDISCLSEDDKRFILSQVVRVSVLTVFKHHQYQFMGVTYRQASGAPIGLRLPQ